ncbi:MAG: WecB/TagA/CpsF family glycosyltransferase [Calothrix sp. MO_167.B42]|nr:WecB/TagA/CpsF family glycosyltransferase [Calothrix sp. MO_167.B42]
MPHSSLIALPVDACNSYNVSKSEGLAKTRNYPQTSELPNLSVHLLGRRITCMTVPAIVEAIHTACITGKKITLAHYNVHSFNLSMQLPWFYEFLQNSEIAHCDSVGIIKAIGYMGLNLPIEYRASYTLLMPKILEKCNEKGFSVFLLGAKPEILETALERLKQQYPQVNFSGHHGYFEKDDTKQNEAVIKQINQANPNILIVGMGMPIQEKWVSQHRHSLDVNAIMVGGAIIDRLAGVVSNCPRLISNMGLEWLYRLSQEPKRLAVRYLLGNPAFVLQMALAKFYAPPLQVQKISSIDRYISEHSTSDSLVANTLNTTHQQSSAHVYSQVKRIVDYFIEANLLTTKQIEAALSEQKVTGILLSELLMKKSTIRPQNIEYIINDLDLV